MTSRSSSAGDDRETSEELVQKLASGGKLALSRALSASEGWRRDGAVARLLDAAWQCRKGHVIGLTGPPGVGKSSLVDALVRRWRAQGSSVGVVAVDPSSSLSGGALLGDRARLSGTAADPGLLVRSLASRGRLGGLADAAFPSAVLMAAVLDRVLIETVGVGQSETEISGIAETVVLCVQPGAGDSLQFMKAGILEVPDVAIITKSDVGAAAARAALELEQSLALDAGRGHEVPVLQVSALTGAGLDELDSAIAAHRTSCEPGSAERLQAFARAELVAAAGLLGRDLIERSPALLDPARPFASAASLLQRLRLTLAPG